MVLVVLAVFGAGFLNSVAGGGSLISFPALVASGLSPLTANVTNTLALWPGYVGGAAAHARRLRRGDGRLRRFAGAAGLGAVAGAAALLALDNTVFEAVVPYLVLAAAALLAVPESWLARLRPGGGDQSHPSRHPSDAAPPGPRGSSPSQPPPTDGETFVSPGSEQDRSSRTPASARAGSRPGVPALLVIGVGGAYGAYFGGALGVVLLAILIGGMGDDLPHANATKNTLSLVINTVALVVFVGLAPVDWTAVAVGAPASLAGALLGAAASARVNATWLRYGIVTYALVAGLVLLLT